MEQNELLNKLEEYLSEHKSVFYGGEITDREIVEQVRAQAGIGECLSILLRGSRANGRENPLSDVDVVVLTREEQLGRLRFEDRHGVHFDIHLFGPAFLDGRTLAPVYRFFYGMRPIHDPQGYGALLVSRIAEYESAFCANIVKEEAEYPAYLRSVLELADTEEEAVSFFAKAKLLREYPAFLAAYNGYNLIGFKTTIDCLIRDRCELAMLYAAAISVNAARDDLSRLIDRSFCGLCGLNVLNTDFRGCKTAYDIPVDKSNLYVRYKGISDFFGCIDYLIPEGGSAVDFFTECEKEAPVLYKKLRSLME